MGNFGQLRLAPQRAGLPVRRLDPSGVRKPALPLLATVITALFGKALLRERSHLPIAIALAGSFVFSLLLLFRVSDHAEALAEARGAGTTQVVGCHREGINRLFASANPTPQTIPIEEVFDAFPAVVWPLLVAVDDDGIGFHPLRRGEDPGDAIMFLSWPERVLRQSERS